MVFDSFMGALELHRLDPNSGVESERFYRTVVDPLRLHGAAVILLDHLTKNKDTRGRFLHRLGTEDRRGRRAPCFEIVRDFGRGRETRRGVVSSFRLPATSF
jgi:hypothetical protein